MLSTSVEAKDRKLEIKRKQDRLAELRQARINRGESIPGLSSLKSTTSLLSSKEDIESFVESLIGPTSPIVETLIDGEKEIEIKKKNVELEDLPMKKDLGIDCGINVNLLPEEKVTYSKEIQTETYNSTFSSEENDRDHDDTKKGDNLPIQEEVIEIDMESKQMETDQESAPIPIELSLQETSAILKSEPFQHFLDQSCRVIERALHDDYDILKDYTQDDHHDNRSRSVIDKRELFLKDLFMHERWTKCRYATSLDWSPLHPELLLVSLGKNSSNFNESNGIILVWNIHMPSRPEFVLHSQSEVTAAKFSPFQPSVIFAGTYSGQVLIFDFKIKSTPIISTSLSLPGHSHPVYSIAIIGTHNASNLVTASTDGTVCTWQTDILNEPQELIELIVHNENVSGLGKTEEVAVTCLAFSRFETSSVFFIGTEERNIYQVNRFDRAGNKAGIERGIIYEGHKAAITGIDFYPFSSTPENGILLSCSMDWTIKLWKVQSPSTNTCIRVAPVKTFEQGSDYIADVAWCPAHPAVFASIDGSGNIDIYNLNLNPDASIHRFNCQNSRGNNKVKWDKTGDKLAVCSLDGSSSVFDSSSFSSKSATSRTLLALSRFHCGVHL